MAQRSKYPHSQCGWTRIIDYVCVWRPADFWRLEISRERSRTNDGGNATPNNTSTSSYRLPTGRPTVRTSTVQYCILVLYVVCVSRFCSLARSICLCVIIFFCHFSVFLTSCPVSFWSSSPRMTHAVTRDTTVATMPYRKEFNIDLL